MYYAFEYKMLHIERWRPSIVNHIVFLERWSYCVIYTTEIIFLPGKSNHNSLINIIHYEMLGINCVFLFLITHFLVKVEVFSEDYVLLLCVPTVDVVVLGGDV